MTCKCGSTRIISIYGKCSDLSVTNYGPHEHEGYVPYGLGIGGGDDISFKFCADCGTIQKFKPLTEADILAALEIETDEEDDEELE
jgi:hypothetical protein